MNTRLQEKLPKKGILIPEIVFSEVEIHFHAFTCIPFQRGVLIRGIIVLVFAVA